MDDREGLFGGDDDHADEEVKQEECHDVEEEEHQYVLHERRNRKDFEIYVGGLDKGATEDDLKKVFAHVGEVSEIRILKNPQTKKSESSAFLRFATVEQAKRAVEELKSPMINGKKCSVTSSHDNATLFIGNICKTWTPEALRDKLRHYGVENLDDIELIEDSKNLNGYAFLDFSSRSDAMDAHKSLLKKDVMFGVEIPAKVSFADSFLDVEDEIMAQVKTIFIDGLSPSWTEEHVRVLLERYGKLEKIELARNMPSARRKDCGFVTFDTHEAAVSCAKFISNSELGEGEDKAKVRARLSRPPQKANKGRQSSRLEPLSLFSSIPTDILMNILARLPSMFPILSCISKRWRNVVCSREIQGIRTLLRKESLYIVFWDSTKPFNARFCHWFRLNNIDNIDNYHCYPIHINSPEFKWYSFQSIVAVGPEIFLLPVGRIDGFSRRFNGMYIFDTRNGKLRKGPSLLAGKQSTGVGVVNDKIYVIPGNALNINGGAEVFDLKKQNWSSVIHRIGGSQWKQQKLVSCNKNLFALGLNFMVSFDTVSGSCEKFKLPRDDFWSSGICVLNNVLYVYFQTYGLMWFDPVLKVWRIVYGVDRLVYGIEMLDRRGCTLESVTLVEYYGKLAFVVEGPGMTNSDTKTIWLIMCCLVKSHDGCVGGLEQASLIAVVPSDFTLRECVSISG